MLSCPLSSWWAAGTTYGPTTRAILAMRPGYMPRLPFGFLTDWHAWHVCLRRAPGVRGLLKSALRLSASMFPVFVGIHLATTFTYISQRFNRFGRGRTTRFL